LQSVALTRTQRLACLGDQRQGNAKEFAVLAGVSYSTSREWFHIQDFPAFNGVVFWEDFVMWRQRRTGIAGVRDADESGKNKSPLKNYTLNLPAKAKKLLSQP
jgi:hypothetical protein